MNIALLEYEMKRRGITRADLCRELNISRVALYRKMKGITEFNLSEVKKIGELLDLQTLIPIFFADCVS